MTDKEKVLQALEHCDLCSDMPNCPGCAYLREPDCMEHLKRGIIALLKAQEPRVMTLEEVLATEVVYAEDIDKAEIIPVLVSRRAHDRIVLVRAHLMGGPSHVIYPLISEYGKRWRCWTSRPDEKTREATPCIKN